MCRFTLKHFLEYHHFSNNHKFKSFHTPVSLLKISLCIQIINDL